jgi:hypothetical protein
MELGSEAAISMSILITATAGAGAWRNLRCLACRKGHDLPSPPGLWVTFVLATSPAGRSLVRSRAPQPQRAANATVDPRKTAPAPAGPSPSSGQPRLAARRVGAERGGR